MTKEQLYKKACSLPMLPGVYIISDKKGVVIYVGKAKRLRVRVSQYFREGVPHEEKVEKMIENAYSLDTIVTSSEFEALVLECSQIKQHRPKYNILLKDDKGYSYIHISNEQWPRLTLARKKDGKGEFLGPFMSSFALKQMLTSAMDSFLLPRCTRRFPQDFAKQRPCLYKHIGKCMGVCTGKIKHSDYIEAVNNAVALIKNGKGEITADLQKRMEAAAENLEFERAALLRDQINAIEKVSAGQSMIMSTEKEQDIIAFAGTAGASSAAILRFRGGRLVDKKEFLFKDENNLDALRAAFLPRYYLDDTEDIPRTIGIDAAVEDMELLSRLFSEKSGRKVRIYVPERGENKKLLNTAYVNAAECLAQESGRISREEKALGELAALLGFEELPKIIESYDISNWGEGTSVCGMIVFENGKPKKAGYRRFKVKTVQGTDDYASMAEVLSRRAAEYDTAAKIINNSETQNNLNDEQQKFRIDKQFSQKPDLILLDGGRGQVSVVETALKGTGLENVPLYGMVKDNRHRTRAIVNGKGEEIVLSMHRGVFSFVTGVQDEVHRFAIDYQRRAAKGKTFSSGLTQIPGVGPATAKALLKELKTIKAISSATQQQLEAVKGVNKTAAQNIYNYYTKQT